MALLFISGCVAKKEVPKAKVDNGPHAARDGIEQSVQQKVISFNLEGFTQKGTKSWEVKGESAEAVSENEIRLDNIVAKAYGEEAEATITANEGVYDKIKNNVRLKENVKATIENTEHFTEDFGGLTTPLSESARQKKNNLDGNRKRRISITCSGDVEFDYEKNRAYFNKDVKVVSEDGNIDADKITINLDSETKKLKEIVADGNVKITRGENVTYSDKATYVTADKKIILTGRPRLVIYQEGDIESGFLGK